MIRLYAAETPARASTASQADRASATNAASSIPHTLPSCSRISPSTITVSTSALLAV